MNAPSPALDPCRCPLCGQPNACANEIARATTGVDRAPCWCTTVSFAPALLARVPPAAQGKACICAACAAAAARGEWSGRGHRGGDGC